MSQTAAPASVCLPIKQFLTAQQFSLLDKKLPAIGVIRNQAVDPHLVKTAHLTRVVDRPGDDIHSPPVGPDEKPVPVW